MRKMGIAREKIEGGIAGVVLTSVFRPLWARARAWARAAEQSKRYQGLKSVGDHQLVGNQIQVKTSAFQLRRSVALLDSHRFG
jgi:hypothetical protein